MVLFDTVCFYLEFKKFFESIRALNLVLLYPMSKCMCFFIKKKIKRIEYYVADIIIIAFGLQTVECVSHKIVFLRVMEMWLRYDSNA